MSRSTPSRLLALTGAAGLVVLSALLATPAAAADAQVFTRSTNVFDPPTVTINVGDTVTWSNPTTGGGVGHTVTSTSDNWSKDSPLAVPGSSTTFTFEAGGSYTYVCETHPQTMKGTVVVKAAAKPKPTPSRTTSSPRPSPTRTTTSPRPSPSATSTSTTPPIPSVSPPSGSPAASPSAPLPSLPGDPPGTPEPEPTITYDGKGITPSPPTGRGRGLPVIVAVMFVVGVVAGEVRTLRATSQP